MDRYLLEYDLEIRPTKLIQGQGLARLMTEINLQALDINFFDTLEEQEECTSPHVEQMFLDSPWYADILYVLFYLNAPPTL